MNHLRKVTLFLVLAMIAMLASGGLCFGAEKYPTKPIQIIVPYAAGGSSDVLARAVEKTWKKYSPQPMIVVGKPGAGGVLGTEYVVRSKPDGYNVLFAYGSGCDLVMPHLQKMPYDPLKDLAPVARISIHSVVVNVSGKSPFNSTLQCAAEIFPVFPDMSCSLKELLCKIGLLEISNTIVSVR